MVTRRVPVFFGAQTECVSCGKEIPDAFTLETLGRYCSPRCYYADGLPRLVDRAA